MNANDVLRAIERKHYDGALARELVLNSPDDEAIRNRIHLDSVATTHGAASAIYMRMLDYYKDRPLADCVPSDWENVIFRRIDGLLYAKQKLIAIEVKVTVADFKRETPSKRAPWENVTNQFIYATPKGLLTPDMLPKHCGLWEVHPGGAVEITKKAKVNKTPAPMPQQVLVALMYRNAKKRP